MKSLSRKTPLNCLFRSGGRAALVGVLWVPVGAWSQVDNPASTDTKLSRQLEEVVVTARRQSETLQEVPLTVNVVDADALQELNLRNFEEISSVVAGLTLESDSIAPNASMRGVRFDVFSGTTSTIEFYLNDAPIQAPGLVQAMFDIGQVEVLRGPQGTLRGLSSPSGSITATTKRPNLEEFEGYIDSTITDIGGRNLNGAVNLPLAEDKLALRIAGLFERNEANRAESLNNSETSETETTAYRLSLRYEPTDRFTLNLMHQSLDVDRQLNFPVESANAAEPGQPAPEQGTIDAGDRMGVTDILEKSTQELAKTVLQLSWDVAEGHQISYVGALEDLLVKRRQPTDYGDFFGPGSNASLQDFRQTMETEIDGGQSHELRWLSSFGMVDVSLGALYMHDETSVNLIQDTAIFLLAPPPIGPLLAVVDIPVERPSENTEKSVFGNATWQLSDATQLSAGLRYINYEETSQLTVANGSFVVPGEIDETATIYSVSVKHHFNDAVMGYASAGSSWRPGANAVGNFSTNQSEREQRFQQLPPEESDSVEFGVKSDLFDRALRLNGTVFYQRFDNYPYRPLEGLYYVSTDSNGAESVGQFNFVAPVPVDVYGFEFEGYYQATPQWGMGMLYSWSKGTLDDATIPCNDYSPTDGQPDGPGSPRPTTAEIRNSTGGENLAVCDGANFRSNFAPLWTATFNTQYDFVVADLNAYVRGQASLYGNSENDPTNALDDVDSYTLANLYLGVKDPDGHWEVMAFGKNIFETERVLRRDANPAAVSYQVFNGVAAQGGSGESTYRQVELTAPRSFGVSFRYNF